MGLDVYLYTEQDVDVRLYKATFENEDGDEIEINADEWNERYPATPLPVASQKWEWRTEVFNANITHNLNHMAEQAGIYQALWRPDELGICYARDLAPRLERGLIWLRSSPESYRKFNPENGWGNYEGLVDFTRKYLDACIENPHAKIEVCR